MKEQQAINSSSKPVTVNGIVEDLRNIGVQQGDSLLVHASLSRLGWVCGGPLAVIQALQTAVGQEGTIIMPAQSGDWSDPAEWRNPPVPPEWFETIYNEFPAFDAETTPTRGMGRIAELFRTYPGTKRSSHPKVSFCANGKHAELITAMHTLTPQFGSDTPLGKLYDLDAKVLFLGTGYDTCTCFHLAEAWTGKLPEKKMGAAMLDDGQRVWKWFTDFAYDSEDFEQIGLLFDEQRHVQKETIGSAECRIFAIREAVDFARKWLLSYRFAQ
jgi:aminoglycoside 3-N-acetyltransferase